MRSTLLSWAFYGPFLVLILWETAAARRPPGADQPRRWLSNVALGFGNMAIRHVVATSAIVLAATEAGRTRFGVLNQLELPPLLAIPVGFLLLDLAAYWIHRFFHTVPVLWRLHLAHHSDVECDVTTSLRHHPIENLVELPVSLLLTTLLGLPPAAVVGFALWSMGHDRFRHANVRLPGWLDAALRTIIVTPDYHVAHHVPRQTNSNFGATFTWWDRLFGTRSHVDPREITTMDLGLEYLRSPRELWPHRVLAQPFRRRLSSSS